MTEWYPVDPYELEDEDPYDEGYEAAKKGQPLHSSKPEWIRGWEDASDDMKDAANALAIRSKSSND